MDISLSHDGVEYNIDSYQIDQGKIASFQQFQAERLRQTNALGVVIVTSQAPQISDFPYAPESVDLWIDRNGPMLHVKDRKSYIERVVKLLKVGAKAYLYPVIVRDKSKLKESMQKLLLGIENIKVKPFRKGDDFGIVIEKSYSDSRSEESDFVRV